MPKFLDAQQKSIEHPHTFFVPSKRKLESIKPDQNVKVCENKERFWVEVTEINGHKITGRVNNDLVLTHSFKCDDIISFEKKNVMGIY